MARGDDTPDRLTVRVLGAVVLDGPAGVVEMRGRQPSTVLAHLALERRGATRDELAEVLWGDHLSSHWQGALRGVLSKARAGLVDAGLPPTTIRSDDTVIQLDHATLTTDLDEFTELIDDPNAGIDALTVASTQLGQPFLPHDDSEWGRRVRARIEVLRHRVVHRRAEMTAAAGLVDHAIAQLRDSIEADPLDETAHHLLIALLLDDGQRVAASDAFDRLTSSLAHELGVAPSPATAELFRRADEPVRGEPARAVLPADAAPHTAPRPAAPMHPHRDDPFVGRSFELAALRAAWSEAVRTNRPHLAVVHGPAGMGKTRLVDRFCAELRATGEVGHVVWGRNRGTVDRAYGGLADAIDRLLIDEPGLVERLGDRLTGLAPLLPGHSVGPPPGAAPEDSAMSRAAITQALRVLLTDLLERPTIWFTDDLQWASRDSIATIEEAVDGLSGPLLVVATTRSVDGDVATALASLQRVLPTSTLTLDGLTVDDIATLFADAAIAPTVRHHTAGLPFYASELARVARLTGDGVDLDHVPPAITDWVSRRVHSLESGDAHLLQVASVIGNDIDLDVLIRCAAGGPLEVARSCDVLIAAGLLTSTVHVDGGDSSSLQFSHQITRDVVYDDIGPASRTMLHRHVADTLSSLDGDHAGQGRTTDHAALAHHYGLAGEASRRQAWTHAMQAGREAMRSGAWVAAERQYARAIDRAPELRAVGHALVGRGRAEHAQLRFDDARATLHEAIELAERDHAATVHATATLALVGRAGRGAALTAGDEAQVRLLRDALAMIERHDTDDHDTDDHDDGDAGDVDRIAGCAGGAELISALERELALSLLLIGSADERAQLLERSVERARRLRVADHETLATAILGSRYAKLDPADLDSRLADIDEVLGLPARSISDDTRLAAYCYRHEDLLRLGRFDEAADALQRAERLVARYPHPYWAWAIRTWRALAHLHTGDLERAEAEALGAATMRPQVAEAAACLAVNLVDIRLYQGRAGEMVPVLAAAVALHPHIPAYRAVLALCASEAGDTPLAATSLRWFADAGFANLPHDTNRFLALAVLAHVTAAVEDHGAAHDLGVLLGPARDHWVVLQCYGGGGAMWGPVAHALAQLAALAGHTDDAAQLYDRAERQAATAPLVAERIAHDRRQRRLAS